ncbi:PIN domain-containing protein [Blastopirellula sp. JC732]|uniref:PIN domain-containing protein n=1 Tax=Blastopirellula sediminis TaxID=2894196 RepID=A0A9X1MSZ6_9BACT|nr:PIN domain-containing protein [Blastopirellula sediminis]MCC9604851.1 PIN domain-containing protein [Blastopirellula sediminis]MCC9631850.1 PIN domain-containing protein [Blastopirellula sediminis]
MRILVDTSILVRTSQPDAVHFASAVDAVMRLFQSDSEPCIVPQVVYEYWVVATRPAAQNGLNLSVEETTRELDRLSEFFHLLRDERAIFEQWQQLVERYQVQGKNAHDARLVAAMLRHGVKHLLTLNPKDFQRYSEIVVYSPDTLPADLANL